MRQERERFIRRGGRGGGRVVKGTKKDEEIGGESVLQKEGKKDGWIKKKDTTAAGEIGALWQRQIQTLSIIFGDFVNKGEERTGWPRNPR